MKFNKKDLFIFVIIFLVGLFLRLLPGSDRYSWIYDQARDAYRSQSIISEKNVILVGPQTDYPGLNHGPLYYYLLAPTYYFFKGDPNASGLVMILINLSSLVPLYLLTEKLFKNKHITWLACLHFAISYGQIEYARWIFNFSVSIPLLLWSYLFLFKILNNNINHRLNFLAGLFLGLSIQGEIFLLYLIPVYLLFLYFYAKPYLKKFTTVLLGTLLGLSPLIIAEFKFGFLGTKTFINEFLAGHSGTIVDVSTGLLGYINHMGVVAKHSGLGLSYSMGFLVLITLIGLIYLLPSQFNLFKGETKDNKKSLLFVLGLFLSHALLFTFHFPEKVFLDFAVFIPLIILTAYFIGKVYQVNYKLIGIVFLLMIAIFNTLTLKTNLEKNTLFDNYHFIQRAMFFSQKIEILDKIYEYVGEDDFTFSVLGTPYGVRTVWASVFNVYLQRHPNLKKPDWHGFAANGYENDQYLKKTDQVGIKHILLIEDGQDLISPYIRDEFMLDQNSKTKVLDSSEVHRYKVEFRTLHNK